MKNSRILLIILPLLLQLSSGQQDHSIINHIMLRGQQAEELTNLKAPDNSHNAINRNTQESYNILSLNTSDKFSQQTDASTYHLNIESLKHPSNNPNKFVLIELSIDPQYLSQNLSTQVRLCLNFNSIDNVSPQQQGNLLRSHANDINYLATAAKCDISDIWAWKEQSYRHTVSFEFRQYFDTMPQGNSLVYISVHAQSLSPVILYALSAKTTKTLPCPNNCSRKANGICNDTTGICSCSQGMTGGDCSLTLNKITGDFNSILLHSATTQIYYTTLGKNENQLRKDDKLRNMDNTNNTKPKDTLTQLIFNLDLSQPQTVIVIYVLISSNTNEQSGDKSPYPSYSNSNYFIQLTPKDPKFTLYDIQADCYRHQDNIQPTSQANQATSSSSSCTLGISIKQLNSQSEAVMSVTINTQNINSSMEHSAQSIGSVLGMVVIITVIILISLAIIFCIFKSLCFKITKNSKQKSLQNTNNNKDKSTTINKRQLLPQEVANGANDYSRDGFPPLQEIKKAPSTEQIIHGVKNRLKSQSFAKLLQPKKQLLQGILMPMEVYTAFASGVPTERVQISGRFSTNTTEAATASGGGSSTTSRPTQAGQSRSCCSVCFVGFIHNQSFQRTICGHIFHPKCLSNWLISSDDCPLCRQSFEFIQIIDFLTKESKTRCISMEERTQIAIQRSLLVMQFIKQDEKLVEMSDEQFIQQFYVFFSDAQKALVDENNAFKKQEKDTSKYITLPTTVSENQGDKETCKEEDDYQQKYQEKQHPNYDEESLKPLFLINPKNKTPQQQQKEIQSLVHSADLDKTNNAEETKGNIVENTITKCDMSFRQYYKTQDSNNTNCSMFLSKKQLSQLNQQQTQDQETLIGMVSKSSSQFNVDEDKNSDIGKKKQDKRREQRIRQKNQQKHNQLFQKELGTSPFANEESSRLPTAEEEAAIDQ